MAFFDPFLDKRTRTREGGLGAPLDTDEDPAADPCLPAQSPPSGLPSEEPAAEGDAPDAFAFSGSAGYTGESSLEESAPAFDLKAFHRHVREDDSLHSSAGAAARGAGESEDGSFLPESPAEPFSHLEQRRTPAPRTRGEGLRHTRDPLAPQDDDRSDDDGNIFAASSSTGLSDAHPPPESASQTDAPWTDVPGPSWEALDQEARKEPFSFIDFEPVPCSPVTNLPYLSSLCPNAQQEVAKKMRPDVLRPSDTLQLPLYQAELLMSRGKMKIKFPSFYEFAIIDALVKDPLTVDLAAHCLFYFDLGLYLCSLLPPYDWPVQHLRETLRSARHRRRVHIITHHRVLEKQFVGRLTFPEICVLKEMQKEQAGPRGPFSG
ncbi:putative GINS complex subunit Psf3 [Besnoitia besnoiti]|uniref:Putative GINS complex subunit Psf3 n=1 Tax=Besnoitia besnoiti TaxID=94643 RepID=A0A2A9M662_BESBE|nr:putative GINS complex subunit Psf3 [Besnoitia besnoiti]PFH33439.1 putative GINS complex subunit Psf3 [Besnoitia besnoiti]